MLDKFSQIKVESPVDIIIRQIKDSISSGHLKPGDRLPSERQLSDRFGVTRTYLRDALRKLEFYGILKTVPQSGTYVAGLGIPALESLISDMLDLKGKDFKSLVETRVILETNLAQLAAMNRTDDDLRELELALAAHRKKITNKEDAIGEDFLFHLKIADASKNSVLKSMMLIITPDIMQFFTTHNICADGRSDVAVRQHEKLFEHILNKDPIKAGESLKMHLADIVDYVQTLKGDVRLNGGALKRV